MSEYWGIPLLPFFSCAPAEKVPRFVFDFLAPSVRHFDGVAEKAPYGLRKLESSLLRKYGADEVVVAHPDHVSKFVYEEEVPGACWRDQQDPEKIPQGQTGVGWIWGLADGGARPGHQSARRRPCGHWRVRPCYWRHLQRHRVEQQPRVHSCSSRSEAGRYSGHSGSFNSRACRGDAGLRPQLPVLRA